MVALAGAVWRVYMDKALVANMRQVLAQNIVQRNADGTSDSWAVSNDGSGMVLQVTRNCFGKQGTSRVERWRIDVAKLKDGIYADLSGILEPFTVI